MPVDMLVPLDGSSLAEHAVLCPAAFARAAHVRLILLRVVPDAAGAPQALAELAALEARLRRDGVDTTIRVRSGAAAPTIVEEAAGASIALVALSTHGRSGLGRWLYGSVTDAVLRHSPVPVLLVPATCEHSLPDDRPPRILVPLDGSVLAEAALAPAVGLARQLRGRVLLVRVIEPPLPRPAAYGQGYPYVEFNPHIELEAARRYLHDHVRALVALGLPDDDVDLDAVLGTPAAAIARVAREQHADVVAMATRGRTGLAGMPDLPGHVLGSVATGTLQLANVPLLLVGPAALQRRAAAPATDTPEALEPAPAIGVPAHVS